MVSQLGYVAAFVLAGPLADKVFEPLLRADGPLAGSVGTAFGTGQGRGTALLVTAMGIALVGVAAAVHAKRADIVRGTEDPSAQGNGSKADGSPNESPAAPAQAALKPSGRPGSTGRLGETKGLGRTGGPVLTGSPGRIGEPGSNGNAGDF